MKLSINDWNLHVNRNHLRNICCGVFPSIAIAMCNSIHVNRIREMFTNFGKKEAKVNVNLILSRLIERIKRHDERQTIY